MNDDDRRLIADCLKGRTDAFGELVRRYQDRLYNSVARLLDSSEDAQDIVQEAFIHAYQSLHSFKGDSEFFTWLYRIAFNAAISLKRRRKVTFSLDQRRDGDDGSQGQGHGLDPADDAEDNRPGFALERSEQEAKLQAALNRLSAEHRTVMVLKDIDGCSYEVIADVMGIPVGTVRSRLHRARSELRDILSAQEERER